MSELLRACRREPTSHTPIWLMRQAGRYQPEYRALREKVSFIELCKTPSLAAEVTLRAVEQLGVDAAIIFADILLILEPLGVGFEFTKNEGPSIPEPLRTVRQIDQVADEIDAARELDYVMKALGMVRRELPNEVALIGFAGAPFTIASYLIEGGGSRDYLHTKRLMFGDKGAWDALMTKLTDATARYLNAQIQAGAEVVQLFDSWVGCLSPADYCTYVQPHMRELFRALPGSTPTIHFARDNPLLYPHMREAGGDVIGIDWRADLGVQWKQLGDVAIMGNLDPGSLVAPREVMQQRARAVLDAAGNRPGHIFNLGHGIFPSADVAQVQALVQYVHEESARRRS